MFRNQDKENPASETQLTLSTFLVDRVGMVLCVCAASVRRRREKEGNKYSKGGNGVNDGGGDAEELSRLLGEEEGGAEMQISERIEEERQVYAMALHDAFMFFAEEAKREWETHIRTLEQRGAGEGPEGGETAAPPADIGASGCVCGVARLSAFGVPWNGRDFSAGGGAASGPESGADVFAGTGARLAGVSGGRRREILQLGVRRDDDDEDVLDDRETDGCDDPETVQALVDIFRGAALGSDSFREARQSCVLVIEIARALFTLRSAGDVAPTLAAEDVAEPTLAELFASPDLALECVRTIVPIVFSRMLSSSVFAAADPDAGSAQAQVGLPQNESRDATAGGATQKADEPNGVNDGSLDLVSLLLDAGPRRTAARLAAFRRLLTGLSCGPHIGNRHSCGPWMELAASSVLDSAVTAINEVSVRQEFLESIELSSEVQPSIADLIVLARVLFGRTVDSTADNVGQKLLARALSTADNAALLFRAASASDILGVFALLPESDLRGPLLYKTILAVVKLASTGVVRPAVLGALLDECLAVLLVDDDGVGLCEPAALGFEQLCTVSTEAYEGCAQLRKAILFRVQADLEQLFQACNRRSGTVITAVAQGIAALALCENTHDACSANDSCLWRDILETSEICEVALRGDIDRPAGPDAGVKVHLLTCGLMLMMQSLKGRTSKPSEMLRPHFAELFADTKQHLVAVGELCVRWSSRVHLVRSVFHALDICVEVDVLRGEGKAFRALASLFWFGMELALGTTNDLLEVSMTHSTGPAEGEAFGYDGNSQALQIDEALVSILTTILERFMSNSASRDPGERTQRERAVLDGIVAIFGRALLVCECLCGAFQSRPDLFRGPYEPDDLALRRTIIAGDDDEESTERISVARLDSSLLLFSAATAFESFSRRLVAPFLSFPPVLHALTKRVLFSSQGWDPSGSKSLTEPVQACLSSLSSRPSAQIRRSKKWRQQVRTGSSTPLCVRKRSTRRCWADFPMRRVRSIAEKPPRATRPRSTTTMTTCVSGSFPRRHVRRILTRGCSMSCDHREAQHESYQWYPRIDCFCQSEASSSHLF
jgi:hypothetical protein